MSPHSILNILYQIFHHDLSFHSLQKAHLKAGKTKCSIFHILLTDHLLSQSQLLKALSHYYNIETYQGNDLTAINGMEAHLDQILHHNMPLHATFKGRQSDRPIVVICPTDHSFTSLHQRLTHLTQTQQPCMITDRARFRKTVENGYQKHFNDKAIYELVNTTPHPSACQLTLSSAHFSPFQKSAALLGLICMALYFITSPIPLFQFLYGAGLLLTPVFLAILAWKIWAILTLNSASKRQKPCPISAVHDHNLPVYTVLVPLYQEHRILSSLTQALDALDYPKEKLDIKLLLEADDIQTQHCAKNLNLPCHFECIIVPHSLPKTKPKALNYAMPFVKGDYIVIYDAEDRPEPDQLRKALWTFENGTKNLACVQAMLNIYNAETNWLTRQFTLEYNTLFTALLPALSRLNLPFLLGGTSNHFRRAALRKVGGWDAFNVTEDADLGIRLYRAGYRCTTVNSTTFEESCDQVYPWFKQRTRWLKGWMQTYCVHMTSPKKLWQQLGSKGFLCFQIILGGQILSSLGYLFLLLITLSTGLYRFFFASTLPSDGKDFFALTFSLFIFSFLITGWLSLHSAHQQKQKMPRKRLSGTILSLPLYWVLISIAAIRAAHQLFTKPFYWEKTTHGHSLQPSPTPNDP